MITKTRPNAALTGKTSHKGTVRALSRAGAKSQFKGDIHETPVQDMRNARYLLQMNEAMTQFIKSATATTVDLVSTETAEKAGLSRRMVSGVSSNTTGLLSQCVEATGSDSLSSAIGRAARTKGVTGAIVEAGIEAIKGVVDLAKGDAEAAEVIRRVIKASAKRGLSSAAAGAAATAASASAAAAVSALGIGGAAATAIMVGAPIVAAAVIRYMASKTFDFVCDLITSFQARSTGIKVETSTLAYSMSLRFQARSTGIKVETLWESINGAGSWFQARSTGIKVETKDQLVMLLTGVSSPVDRDKGRNFCSLAPTNRAVSSPVDRDKGRNFYDLLVGDL